jgi:hypothetical protein
LIFPCLDFMACCKCCGAVILIFPQKSRRLPSSAFRNEHQRVLASVPTVLASQWS